MSLWPQARFKNSLSKVVDSSVIQFCSLLCHTTLSCTYEFVGFSLWSLSGTLNVLMYSTCPSNVWNGMRSGVCVGMSEVWCICGYVWGLVYVWVCLRSGVCVSMSEVWCMCGYVWGLVYVWVCLRSDRVVVQPGMSSPTDIYIYIYNSMGEREKVLCAIK